ncbi:hypothetical protein [Martelella mangrovi]|uniref:hypothetical protein n=1 Tax=Martelella mangrovi TaxID=1397477 RepID=UPI00339838A3
MTPATVKQLVTHFCFFYAANFKTPAKPGKPPSKKMHLDKMKPQHTDGENHNHGRPGQSAIHFSPIRHSHQESMIRAHMTGAILKAGQAKAAVVAIAMARTFNAAGSQKRPPL